MGWNFWVLVYSCRPFGEHSWYIWSLFFASKLAGLIVFCWMVPFPHDPRFFPIHSSDLILVLMFLRGPTFIPLNLSIHLVPSTLLSLLSSDSVPAFSPVTFFFLLPAPAVQHDRFCPKHPTQVSSAFPPLIWGRHSQPFV